MNSKSKYNTQILTAIIAMFAAIISIGNLLTIPIGPVPIVLQNALCIITGILLGGLKGALPTVIFLIAGLAGLPVYSGGGSGFAQWLGPTGGFLPGYLLGALVAGLIAGTPDAAQRKPSKATVIRVSLAMVAGMIILYVPGVWYFAKWAAEAGRIPADKTAFAYTMGACVIPYIPGDIAKCVIGIPLALALRPTVAQYIQKAE